MPELGEPYAHLAADGKLHLLDDHLNAVGNLAGSFASQWGAEDWAYLAGLWHDLGKYSAAFQAYIRSANGFEAHIEDVPGRVDHSSAGALHAVSRFESEGLGLAGRILAYAIAGHHAGLADWVEEGAGATPLSLRISPQRSALLKAALEGSVHGGPDAQLLDSALPRSRPKQGADPALWIRMIFSSLVDADFLDTEAFF